MRNSPRYGRPIFARHDRVTVGDGQTVYTVLAVGQAGLDVFVTEDPNRGGGTWVAIGDVRHASNEPEQGPIMSVTADLHIPM